MEIKINFRRFGWLFISASVLAGTGCMPASGGNGGNSSLAEPSLERLGSKCYPGADGGFQNCLNLVSLRDVQAVSRDYNYPDPNRDRLPSGLDREKYRPPQNLADTLRVPNFSLTRFFTLYELIPNQRGRFGAISAAALNNFNSLRAAANVPIIVNSAYRSPSRNDGIDNSAQWSRHMYGDAFDFYSPRKSLRQLRRLCQQYGASFIQLYTAHVHCDWRNLPSDPDFFGSGGTLPPTVIVDRVLQDLASLDWYVEGNVLHAKVDGVIREDDGELLHAWALTLPNGKLFTSADPVFRYELSIEGRYSLRVEVGGHIVFAKEFDWTRDQE